MKVLVSHELVRIVENDSWRFEVQEKDWSGKWTRVYGGGEYFNFDHDVIDEFAKVLANKVD